MPDAAQGFNNLYLAISGSAVFRDIVKAADNGLPDWVLPFDTVDRPLLERMAAELRVGDGDTFLDFGCGGGGASLFVSRLTGASVTGVDFAPHAVEIATALAARLGWSDRAHFLVADAADNGLAEGSFDAVMCVDAMMFIDPHRASREIYRVLRPRGRIVMTAAESLIEPFEDTLVRDYRPVFERAGFQVLLHEELPRGGYSMRFYRELERRGNDLRSELGEPADALILEARNAIEREEQGSHRVREVLFVAERVGS